MISKFFATLYRIFVEAFSLDYNNTLFCSQNDKKVKFEYTRKGVNISNGRKTKGYGIYVAIIIFLLILLLGYFSYQLNPFEIPPVDYKNSRLTTEPFLYNTSFMLFQANSSYDAKKFNFDQSFGDDSYIYHSFTSIDNISLIYGTEFGSFLSYLTTLSNNQSLIFFFGDDFVMYVIRDVGYKLSVVNIVGDLNVNDFIDTMMLFFSILTYFLHFIFYSSYVILLSYVYILFTRKGIPFVQLVRFSTYAFIPASIINFLIFHFFSVDFFFILIMLIFVINSLIHYKPR